MSINESIIVEKVSHPKVLNFMGMDNYVPSYLMQLKLLITTWFIGEPTYYIDGKNGVKNISKQLPSYNNKWNSENNANLLIQNSVNKSTMDIFIEVVNGALNENFEETLKLAVQARNEYMMRSGPCAVLYYASTHPKRKEFNVTNPLLFRLYASTIIKIPTDAWMIFNLWKQGSDSPKTKNSKKKLPTILKKVIATHLQTINKYQMKKYLNKCHLIDLIRISHPKSNEMLTEVVKTGTIQVEDNEQTWEKLRSEKKNWKQIVEILGNIPHMALLRNLVGITKDTNDPEYLDTIIIPMLKNGVKYGKQFPFSYMTALDEVKKLDIEFNNCKSILVNGISDCVEIAMENFPVLEGNTICLSDNSGSAHGTFPSKYGQQNVARISNLSAAMTAKNCSGKGYVGIFGDNLELFEIDKNKKVLDQVELLHKSGKKIGGSTENGIWIFFKKALNEANQLITEGKKINRENMKYWFENIFIMSDQQASHAGLYGSTPDEYTDYVTNGKYIDVLKLIKKYRELINPIVNVYSVQVAGYNNNLIPEMMYRTNILSGWTGCESVFASNMNKLMDDLDNDIMTINI
jgi:hypothetical protein